MKKKKTQRRSARRSAATSEKNSIAADLPFNDPRFSADAVKLVDKWVRLPPDQQEHIYEIVKAMALPMDPNYRTFEKDMQRRNSSRDGN